MLRTRPDSARQSYAGSRTRRGLKKNGYSLNAQGVGNGPVPQDTRSGRGCQPADAAERRRLVSERNGTVRERFIETLRTWGGVIPDAAMDAFLRAAEDTPEGLSESFYDSVFGECVTDQLSDAFNRGMDRMRAAYARIVHNGMLEERLDAFDRLGRHTSAWSEGLLVLRGLRDSSELARLTAVKALAKRGHPALAISLAPLLHDSSPAVRAAAAGALGALGDTSAVPELESLLAEPDVGG